MHWVLLILIAAILHASLYPWEFTLARPEVNPLLALVSSWEPLAGKRPLIDIAVNIFFYIPLGAAAYITFVRRFRPKIAAVLAVAAGFALSASVEMAQLFTPRRVCNTWDLISNILGAAIGAAAARVLWQRVKHVSTPHPHAPAGALILLCCWAAYQFFPFYPETTRHALVLKLYGLLDPAPFSLPAAALAAAEWLAVTRLAALCFGPQRAPWLAGLFLLALPAKLLVAGRTAGWSEILGALAGAGMGALLPVPFLTAAGLLAAAVAARALSPFEFSGGRSFRWVPFVSLIGTEWGAATLMLLRKVFWYGSILVLLRAARVPRAPGAAALVLLLAAIEAAQIRIPGHVAETTDPLLAALIAFALRPAPCRPTASPRRTSR